MMILLKITRTMVSQKVLPPEAGQGAQSRSEPDGWTFYETIKNECEVARIL
jgi:hypothetical protein